MERPSWTTLGSSWDPSKIRKSPIGNYSERDLVRVAQSAGFEELRRELHIDVIRCPIPNRQAFLETSRHPLGPPLSIILAEQFSEEERQVFEGLMRPLVEAPRSLSTDRAAYLAARKPTCRRSAGIAGASQLRMAALWNDTRLGGEHMPGILAALCALVWLAIAGTATAQTDEIQVYDAEITPVGQWNLTWHNNFTPHGRMSADFPGGVVPDHTLNGVPEWAYGVTNWFEAGAYVPIYSYTNSGQLLFEGVKLRTLFVVPNAADRRFFYGVNFELSYNAPSWDPRRYSGEIRPIIGTHLGRWDLIVNPVVDTEFDGFRNFTFQPEMRVAYNFSGQFALAAEYYADFGRVPQFLAPPEQSQTLFAVVDLGDSAHGIEFGIGHGFTPATDATVIKLMLMQDL